MVTEGETRLDLSSTRYRVIRRLAVGGMAELFLARAEGIEGFSKLVVLKRLLPQYAGDGRFVRMFLQEARLAAGLRHANIVQVFDIEKDGAMHVLAMEYVHGVDVRALLRASRRARTDVPLQHALTIIAATAAGLHHAHESVDARGRLLALVHRDVSPSNVLVSFDGCVKLADFGIAKAMFDRCETRPGTLKGKIPYMSPEQCQGAPLDRRSDVFSLGVVLYELTTGVRPFDGPNEIAVANAIAKHDAPPPSDGRLDYPSALEAIVLRALRRDPNDRFPTALALCLEVEAFAASRGLVLSATALGSWVGALVGRHDDPTHVGAGLDHEPASVSAAASSESGTISVSRPVASAALLDPASVSVSADAVPSSDVGVRPHSPRRPRVGALVVGGAIVGAVALFVVGSKLLPLRHAGPGDDADVSRPAGGSPPAALPSADGSVASAAPTMPATTDVSARAAAASAPFPSPTAQQPAGAPRTARSTRKQGTPSAAAAAPPRAQPSSPPLRDRDVLFQP